jgi:hypothetical protein
MLHLLPSAGDVCFCIECDAQSRHLGSDKCPWEVISIVSRSFAVFCIKAARHRLMVLSFGRQSREKVKISFFNLVARFFVSKAVFAVRTAGIKIAG